MKFISKLTLMLATCLVIQACSCESSKATEPQVPKIQPTYEANGSKIYEYVSKNGLAFCSAVVTYKWGETGGYAVSTAVSCVPIKKTNSNK